mmetsp:Transcript_22109/g.32207  ORF Transcript_22109/g.32207 Transcript_22109/m.32207 type:complete len:363 (+) Transcript_22109:117-1205(+)|eukprot:CAMPEP_0185019034 /NCGR_PEP_ID=MMETSP1103-20130426/1659_1 /TAXON_ID=36769 /ORGANISM="Paraphysomonas bandaiensis, Strain Caron Lab Isolate" /LENGTH=362 /DNA_ID=CAMNT_0027549111 /DNA_START=107 /DNA_END=1195 /DNA_ORIENTATION=-
MTDKSRRPDDTPFKQQRMAAWQPILTPIKVILIFLTIGVIFVPVGVTLLDASKEIYEKTVVYDGDDTDIDGCKIRDTNEGKQCSVTFNIGEDVEGPVYVYYELENFYQNHRRYVKSRSSLQLEGENLDKNDVSADCDPLYKNHSLLLNPCGLIANSLFNDVIRLDNSSGYSMDEKGISWLSDRKVKFNNVEGFKKVQHANASSSCVEVMGSEKYSDCKVYVDSDGVTWYYWYPDDDKVQYLHESYPMVVSPIEGVENEHFIVWMRTAGLPTFRKLYGKIDDDLNKGDVLTFHLDLNFEVNSFDGSKAIVISNLGEFGGKNSFLGISYIVVGSVSLLLGVLFALKQAISPRQLGDTRYLGWNT